MLALILASLAAAQGQALRLEVPHEPGLEQITVTWNGHERPLVRQGETWMALLGVDLDTEAGAHEAELSLTYADGRSAQRTEPIAVSAAEFPTTELTVEPRYVELSPEDQQRANRESGEIAQIYATVTPEAHWSEPFLVPIPGVSGGRNFGHRRIFNGQPRAPHSGADLRAATGTPILAANRGRVVLAKELFFSGNAVFVDHGLGVYTVYLHLSRIDVEPGQMVGRGQQVGLAGATGRVTGPHLHWGARIVDARVDPFSLLSVYE
ncbi:MAG: peptidoglycan DD-metalloendopeptidase family protein [Gammaproteobacteria bacterium]|nr:peptidoglycan DD-metalloendopeptidase family protein [Gammaproteobacteria bacterium]